MLRFILPQICDLELHRGDPRRVSPWVGGHHRQREALREYLEVPLRLYLQVGLRPNRLFDFFPRRVHLALEQHLDTAPILGMHIQLRLALQDLSLSQRQRVVNILSALQVVISARSFHLHTLNALGLVPALQEEELLLALPNVLELSVRLVAQFAQLRH